jgi:hypothetical protein
MSSPDSPAIRIFEQKNQGTEQRGPIPKYPQVLWNVNVQCQWRPAAHQATTINDLACAS